jgi:hypothetical protein
MISILLQSMAINQSSIREYEVVPHWELFGNYDAQNLLKVIIIYNKIE